MKELTKEAIEEAVKSKFGLIAIDDLLEVLRQRAEYLKAFLYILEYEGKVCDDFENCKHEPCNSSFQSRQTALEVIDRFGGIEKAKERIDNYEQFKASHTNNANIPKPS